MPRMWLFSWLLALAACPQANQADPAAGKVDPPPVAEGRVVVQDGDLYPAKNGVTPPPPEAPAKGSGLSDETNGVCRLFAPELPNPTCCERQLGFDVAAAREACGFQVYLGESFHGTCGYYFVGDVAAVGAASRWFRLSAVAGETPKQAADNHDRRTKTFDGFTPSTPVVGIDGAHESTLDDLHWMFLPGWSTVRMLTWSDASCSADGVLKVARQLIATPEVPAGTPRASVIPGAPAAAATNAAEPGPAAPTAG